MRIDCCGNLYTGLLLCNIANLRYVQTKIEGMEEALEAYDKIPSERMNADKCIGFCIEEDGGFVGMYELVVNDKVQRENINSIYQINDAEKNREYRCRSYAYQIEHGFMITTDNYEISYCAKASQGLFPAKIRENMESLNARKADGHECDSCVYGAC